MNHAVPVLIVLMASMLPAAEVMRRDAILALGVSDPGFDYTISSPVGEFSGTDQFDRSLEARLGGRWSWARPGWQVAPIFGADAVIAESTYGSGGLAGYGADLAAGVAWAPFDRWQFEGEIAYGQIKSTLNLPESTTGGGLDASGMITRQRLVARVLRSLDRRWLASLDLGWSAWDGTLAGDQDRDVQLTGGGWSVALGVSWRWSSRPEAFE